MNKLKMLAFVIVGTFVVSAVFTAMPSEAAPQPFEITDSTGKTFTFNGPANKVVSFAAHTLTVIELGCKDKIVGIDYYSTSGYLKGDPRVDGLDPLSVGTVSSKTVDSVVASLVQLVDDNKFNLETDVVLSVAWASLTKENGLRDQLVSKGFKVLSLKGDTYEEIVEIVGKIGKAIGSSKTDTVVNRMLATKAAIQNKVNENVPENERVGFILAWYSSGKLKIGNKGSIAVGFAETAGGKNLGEDKTKTGNTYDSEVSAIIQAKPDIVITSNYEGTSKEYQENVLHTGDIRVLALKSTWNNYCPDAEVGLKMIAKYLYPSLFEDFEAQENVDYADVVKSEDDKLILYVAAGLAITAIAVIGAVFLLRR